MSSGADSSVRSSESDGHYHFKILIPAAAVGSIMGKNGEVVNKLENDTDTKIMISGLKDCYPGTKERVCLIAGGMENILMVNRIIMTKMSQNPELCFKGKRGSSWRPKQVKIIIPQCTASKIIGKGGSCIEKMKAESGSFIQLSRKAFPVILRERCLTVSGELKGNDIACRMILQVIADDTGYDYYRNVSYSKANFPLPNSCMSGPPFANAIQKILPEAMKPTITCREMLLFLDTFDETLKNMGFSEEAISDTNQALLAMTRHGVLDFCMSMMVNWFYPLAFATYERNGGLPSLGRVQSSAPAGFERGPRDFSQSMFALADPAASFQSEYSSPVSEAEMYDRDVSSDDYSFDVDHRPVRQ